MILEHGTARFPNYSERLLAMTQAKVLAVSLSLAAAVLLSTGAVAQKAAADAPRVEKVTVNAPVTLKDNGDSWTMDNGIVTLTVLKRNGTIAIGSLMYHGISIVPNRGEFWDRKST